MIKGNITKEQAISMLKWSADAGADEALNETTRYRFINKSENNNVITGIDGQDPILSDIKSRSIDKGLVKATIQVNNEELSATALAKQCHSINDIVSRIKAFPYFKLRNQKDDVVFYNGSNDASVLVFQEPEIYGTHGDDESTSETKKLLFNRIIDSIDKLLSDEACGACGSIVTFPKYFDSSKEAKDYNFLLIRPFLIRYVKLIKPRAIILMDGFLKDGLFNINDVDEDMDFMKRIEIVTFPSLDVLLRAPKRKKDVWNTILDLKTKLKKEE